VKHQKVEEAKGHNKSLFVLGRSLGGAVAIYSSTISKFKTKIDGFIIENTFTSVEDMFSLAVPFFPWKYLLTNKWPS
jgi:alpha-beta hydrolase superfamily lysophospholipase